MATIDNTLAAQVPTFDPATPLAKMAQIQAANQEIQQAQFKQNQLEMGSEMRGLQPFVNTPEFPAKWREAADRLRSRGVINDQMHEQWANAPSPLLMKSIISKTEDPALAFRREEAARDQKNADRSYGLQVRTANRLEKAADEERTVIQEITDPVTQAKTLVRVKRSGPEGPVNLGGQTQQPGAAPAFNPKAPFNQALEKADADRVTSYSEGAKLAEEGIATLDNIDNLRKQAYTGGPFGVAGAVASKMGHPATQALETSANALALDVAQKMKGSLSDKDIAFVKSQVPTAATAGDAGDAASGAIRAGFERTKQRALFFRAWAENNQNIRGADAAWNRYVNENPLTVEDKKALGGRKFDPNFNKDFSRYLPPQIGSVQDGYRYRGGDPGDKNSWVRAQ